METFSALLAICAGNSPDRWIPRTRPVTRSFDVFFDLRLNKLLSKQSWSWWFETQSRPLWRHCHEFAFSNTSHHIDGTGNWNSPSWITNNRLSYLVNTMAADVLATQGARLQWSAELLNRLGQMTDHLGKYGDIDNILGSVLLYCHCHYCSQICGVMDPHKQNNWGYSWFYCVHIFLPRHNTSSGH